jgi:hypothetical protein
MEMGSGSLADSSGGSSSSSPPNSSSDSLNGLKFGRKIYFEDGPGAPTKPGDGPGSTPPKKVRGSGGGGVVGGQPPRCQVEGCKVDLSDAKAYYSRHKVCGMHSKSPKVIVAGLEQRFCQQCSRSATPPPLFYYYYFLICYSRCYFSCMFAWSFFVCKYVFFVF